MPVKVTMFFQLSNYSWSEAHYYLGGSTFTSAFGPAIQLCNNRAALLGGYAKLAACRLSLVPANRVVSDLDPSTFNGTGGQNYPGPGNEGTADRAYSCLLLQFTSLVGQKNMYLAGIPDEIVQSGSLYPNGYVPYPEFTQYFEAYRQFLTSSLGSATWGYRSRVRTPGVPIIELGTQVGFGNNIGLISAVTLGVVVGQEIYLTGFRRINTRLPGLSGAFTVLGITPPGSGSATWTTVLSETGNVEPGNFITMGQAAPLTYQYPPYTNLHIIRATSRKRGGSFGQPHGRLRARR